MPEHDLAAADAEERRGPLSGSVTLRRRAVPEDEGRFDVSSPGAQLDDPAGAGQRTIESNRVRVRVQSGDEIALDDLGVARKEVRGALIVPGVERVAPGADDAAR